MVGLSSGLETLCGQANGARQHHLLGIYLQRSLLIIFTISLPITIMWTQAERVLVFLGQEPALSRLAARYLLCMIPSLWLAAAGECLRRYLMAQSAVKAPMFIVAGNTALSPLVHYLFIFKMGWGLYGGAAAVLVANLGSAGMLAAYAICWPGSHRRAWPGFSADAFRGWGVYLRIAVPSTAMLVCEWWAFEFVLLAAGLLEDPDVALSAMGLCFQVTSLLYMVPLGLGGAISTRVSNELGAYRPQQARMAALVCAGLIVLSQGSMSVMVIALRQYVPRLFTSDQRVIDLAAKCLFPLGISVIGDGLQCVLSGLLRGSGRPALGAYISLATYWGAGLPFAWLFGFHFGMGAVGLWVGLACTTNLQGLVVSGVVALVMDWESEAKRAARLVREASVHSLGRLQADGKTLGQTLDAERGQHPAWRTSGASAGGGDSTSPTRRPLEV
ncbi:unnamed protein product [Pedinophyceae sp. YPF-701]|nr:unnamed protein product [Pedinophyceae sp. YPF-701]